MFEDKIENWVDEVINNTSPKAAMQWALAWKKYIIGNEAVFTFVSKLMGIPGDYFKNLSQKNQISLCQRWYNHWKDEMFDGHYPILFEELLDFEEVCLMFLDIIPKVKRARQDIYNKAVALAESEVPPVEANNWESPKIRLLVALCYQLQELNPEEPFFLSGKNAGEALGISQSRAAILLRGLCRDGLLKIRAKGTTFRATRYQYMSIEARNESSRVDNRLKVRSI